MPGTAKELTPEDIKRYREFLKEKEERERVALKIRFKRAWDVAEKAAKILFRKYGAAREWSDIDLAVWGVPDSLFYKAVAEVISLDPDFKIDVVDPEDCSESLRKAIKKSSRLL